MQRFKRLSAFCFVVIALGFMSSAFAEGTKTNESKKAAPSTNETKNAVPPPAAEAKPASKPAADLKLKAVLIWGTDGDKPDDPTLKDLDEDIKKKLRKIFKWKEYHLVKVQNFTLSNGDKTVLKLSPKCTVECENKAAEGLDVKLIGEGKFVKKVKQAMPLTDWLVLGGDDKDSNAWFVLIMPESENPSLKETK